MKRRTLIKGVAATLPTLWLSRALGDNFFEERHLNKSLAKGPLNPGPGVGNVTDTAGSPRIVQSLDRGWHFHLGDEPEAIKPGYDDRAWRQVDVPHDYVVEGTFEEKNRFPAAVIGREDQWYAWHASLPVQPAVYRKALVIPDGAKGKRLWLEFDGVCSNSIYWLNGREIGRQYSGYTRSRFDITAVANPAGENILTVHVDPRYDGWWYEGGGIYRHVRLVAVNPIHIAADGIFVVLTVDDPAGSQKADAIVTVHTEVTNNGSAAVSATVASELVDNDGRVVASAVSVCELGVGIGLKITERIPLAGAHLWSPDNPYLYRLRSTVTVAHKVVDRVSTNFGVRHLRWDTGRGFFLNGKPLKIKGINMHGDHAGVGVAMPDRLFTWRLERLKEVGCNAIRMSHNPVTPFLLDECDRLGFLVIAENRHLGDSYADQVPKETVAVDHRDLSALVLRDRNHPSIILWSLCNEQQIQGTPESAAMARAMIQRVRELDPTREVTAALNGGFDRPEGLAGALDVIGLTYHPDVYNSVHALFPNAPLVATETSSELTTRGIYDSEHWEYRWGNRERSYLSTYPLNGPGEWTAENSWIPVATHPFIAGGFVWAAFDYKGEPNPFKWPVINCSFGFMDICGFPKDSYYYYKAWWTDTPVLHLIPHWNWLGKEGQELFVRVHSNCDEVELFLNGVSQGKQTVTPLHHLEWKVKYAPGKLVAKGIRKGVPMETVHETTGAPAAIRLTADRSALAADNVDLAMIAVEVVDAQGRIVPVADNKIAFKLTGPAKLIGVGNGNPTCHEPDKASSRSAFNGLAQAIVQTTANGGKITFTAESPGLKAAAITLHSR